MLFTAIKRYSFETYKIMFRIELLSEKNCIPSCTYLCRTGPSFGHSLFRMRVLVIVWKGKCSRVPHERRHKTCNLSHSSRSRRLHQWSTNIFIGKGLACLNSAHEGLGWARGFLQSLLIFCCVFFVFSLSKWCYLHSFLYHIYVRLSSNK